MASTLPAVMATSVIDLAVSRGVDRRSLLPLIPGLEGLSPEARIPVEQVLAAWEVAMRALDDPGFPIHYASSFKLEAYPVFGFVVMTAPTGREALDRVLRFQHLVTEGATWTAHVTDDVLEVRWSRPGPRTLGLRVANESAIAELFNGFRQALGRELRALAVRFRHPAPRTVALHDAYFGVPVTWNARIDSVSLPAAILDEVPRFANLALASYFEKEASRLVQAAPTTVSARTQAVVRELLAGGEPASPLAARRLAMSERSLRRALAAEGTSFRELVDDVRRARAEELLADPHVSIAEVAFALGFSEQAAFTRAFKRWTGHTPGEARRGALAG